MADAQLKLSRRALLGAACACHPGLDPGPTFFPSSGAPQGRWIADQACPEQRRRARNDELWTRALALFNRADAAVTALEGASDDDAFDRAADAHDGALERLLLAPAPHIAALAAKLDLAIAHQAWELRAGERSMSALAQDAHRIASAEG